MKYYRVLSRLEDHFASLREVDEFIQSNPVVLPTTPITAQPDEDKTIPRICVAEKLVDCFNGIGLMGVFRRCAGHNPDAKSYATAGLEVYPILIQEFDVADGDVVCPTKEQVPDVDTTNERWIVNPIRPVVTRLYWLDMFSITYNNEELEINPHAPVLCEDVRLETNIAGYNHPWLNGKGHKLDSSAMENEI